MDQRIIMEHWTKGGTAITNFYPEQAFIYAAAIEEYGDPSLIIVTRPYGCHSISSDYSLHKVGKRMSDLGAFWTIFDRIKKAAYLLNPKLNRYS